jgi:hypothetical protein
MENAKSSLSVTETLGMFKAGAANLNGGKDQEGCFFKLSGHALRERTSE